MRAVVITAAKKADVVEMEAPTIGPEEVLVRSAAAGICGSDIELYLGARPEGYYQYPVVPGHEWAGTVVAAGESVSALAPGDKVVAEGFRYCGRCANCRHGLTNLCEAGYDEAGFTRPGGMAEYVAVPSRLIHRLPDHADLHEAALLEPAAVVAHAFLRAAPRPGDAVAVVGDGTIGLLAVQIARLYSPRALILVGAIEDRLESGRRLGATHTVNIGKCEPSEAVRSLTGGRGADLVFEGAGNVHAPAQAVQVARRGGTVVLEGIAGLEAAPGLASDLIVLNHLTVIGIFGASSAAWSNAVTLFNSGLLDLKSLITHRFPLSSYRQALNIVRTREAGSLKVLLTHEAEE